MAYFPKSEWKLVGLFESVGVNDFYQTPKCRGGKCSGQLFSLLLKVQDAAFGASVSIVVAAGLLYYLKKHKHYLKLV